MSVSLKFAPDFYVGEWFDKLAKALNGEKRVSQIKIYFKLLRYCTSTYGYIFKIQHLTKFQKSLKESTVNGK